MTSSLPYISLFSLTLMLSTIMTISATQWIYIWMGLEINMLSFIPLMTSSSTNRETEAAVKYFLAQAMGSGLLLLGAFNKSMFFTQNILIFSEKMSSYFILAALLIKLGAAPCHFWFPIVMKNLSWPLCMILSTWQKIAPLFVMSYSNTMSQSSIVLMIASTGSLVGGIGGLNQTQLRPLLAYSSIGHLGWMIATPSFMALLSYLAVYILLSIAIMNLLWSLSTKHWAPNLSLKSLTPAYIMSLLILFLSLSGLPPFLGFLPKWMILLSMIHSNMSMLWPVLLILGSVIQLFYYLNLMFALYIKTSNYMNMSTHHSSFKQTITLLATCTLGLAPICLMI